MLFSKALILATYKNGRPGMLTEAHKKAELHRFKTQHLFKTPEIPNDLYVSRLIQHLFIIKAIESRLMSLSSDDKATLSAFFSLSYLAQLWRTPAIEQDLTMLQVHVADISEQEITPATRQYLTEISTLSPKNLLAHFLVHVAGFMHGGAVIRTRFIEPSNKLTQHQIPANQYDFSAASALLPRPQASAVKLYSDMMRSVDSIELTEEESAEALKQCQGIYETMSSIYDDLCTMHHLGPKITASSVAAMSVVFVILALLLKYFEHSISIDVSPKPF